MTTRRGFLRNLLAAPAIGIVGAKAAEPAPKIITVEKVVEKPVIVTKEVIVTEPFPQNVSSREMAMWMEITANRKELREPSLYEAGWKRKNRG